ncbi:unnamed protein product [Cylicocyclus nassatus]|uniref:Uncharacterized protein n=1 Tax=Cylicocyclus nassatus TaxID=53992 RepID=A0AA36DPF7_CYLNA|nr:unnamed protein product [Cylicocyclus nassatus]
MVKRVCIMCGNRVDEKRLMRSSKSKIHNAIFLSTLQKYASMEQDLMEICFVVFQTKTKYVCISHIVDAVQHLLAEVVANGGRVSKTAENTSYLNEAEISARIPNCLNEAIKTFSDDIKVSVGDVNRYVNTYLTKYSSHFTLNFHETDYVREDEQPEHAEILMEETKPVSEDNNHSMDTASQSFIKLEELESPVETSNNFFSPSETQASTSDDTWQRAKTDPALLDKYYLVSGRKLLELSGLRCGNHENNTSGEDVWLEESGSTPIIYCTTSGPKSETKCWEGEDRLGPGTQERDEDELSGALETSCYFVVNEEQQREFRYA